MPDWRGSLDPPRIFRSADRDPNTLVIRRLGFPAEFDSATNPTDDAIGNREFQAFRASCNASTSAALTGSVERSGRAGRSPGGSWTSSTQRSISALIGSLGISLSGVGSQWAAVKWIERGTATRRVRGEVAQQLGWRPGTRCSGRTSRGGGARQRKSGQQPGQQRLRTGPEETLRRRGAIWSLSEIVVEHA